MTLTIVSNVKILFDSSEVFCILSINELLFTDMIY
jgi:hypothetical protein